MNNPNNPHNPNSANSAPVSGHENIAPPDVPRVDNPFAAMAQEAPKAPINNASAGTIAREAAMIQVAMQVAMQRPRNVFQIVDAIINDCTRPELAECAIYSFVRGGAHVTGVSVNLARTMAQRWEHLHYDVTILDERENSTKAHAWCWDLQSNVFRGHEFVVKHVRHSRRGVTPLNDPLDVRNLFNSIAAREIRNCILEAIPADVKEAALKQCELTLRASADTSAEGVKKMLERFAEFGVAKSQIEKRIQCRTDAMSAAQMVNLRKIYTSMRDGMSGPDDWFESDAPDTNKADAAKKVAAAAKAVMAQSHKALQQVSVDAPVAPNLPPINPPNPPEV